MLLPPGITCASGHACLHVCCCASLRGIAPVLTNPIITNPRSKTVGKKLKAIKRRGVESLFQKIGVSDGTLDVEYEVRPASRSVDRGAGSESMHAGSID